MGTEKISGTNPQVDLTSRKAASYEDGGRLYSDLRGFTTKNDQNDIKKIINFTDSNTVNSLLSGYYDAKKDMSLAGGAVGTTVGAAAGAAIGTPFLNTAPGAIYGGSIGGGIGMLTAGCDGFFRQMDNEYSFPEKKDLMADVAKKYYEYLKNINSKDNNKEKELLQLGRIVNQNEISSQDIDLLDEIVRKTLK